MLFTIPNFITAHSGRAMLDIIERLDRHLFEPWICVQKRGGKLEKRAEDMGVPLLELPFTVKALPYPGLLFRAWNAAAKFRKYRFVLWHSFHYLDDYTEPLIARFSGASKWVYTKKNMSWNSRSWFLRTLFASHVMAENKDMLKCFFDRSLFRKKTSLSPRGVDTEKYRPNAAVPMNIRGKLGIPRDSLLICCTAHLIPIKGHQYLVRAVSRLGKDIHLVLAGREQHGAYAKSIRDLIRKLDLSGRVHLLGGISNIADLLGETDVYVLPTIPPGEGCGVTTLEAMSAGRACVVTDVPGSRDLITHGESGFLVPAEDSHNLSEALRRLIDSPELREIMGKAARQRAISHFSVEAEAKRHEAVYLELLRR
ncbi:glycosyltransferase [Fibrobacterota bacterium]